jgi:[acyl-carrier-protein] S-malonyltransferase
MTETTAFLFPGQGSQALGMGQDLAQQYPIARDTFSEADDLLGFRLSPLCFEGPEESLNDTINTQPAIFVTSVATLRVLQGEGWGVSPSFVAGHSLGEYSALVASGALTFADGLRLVRERGRLMKEAGERSPGGMAAILKVDDETMLDICRRASQQTGKVVQVANYNSPGQVVISGDNAALDAAMELAQAAGARRVVRLAVSIAAHSPLMAVIADEFRQAVEAAPIQPPGVPVVANITARPLNTLDDIRQEMLAQLTASVRWVASVEYMITHGVKNFVEIGPKDVLTGLVGRINKDVKAVACGTVDGVQALISANR